VEVGKAQESNYGPIKGAPFSREAAVIPEMNIDKDSAGVGQILLDNPDVLASK